MSFNPNVHRVGFACKIQSAHDVQVKNCAVSSTTLTWLNSKSRSVAYERLWDLMRANVAALSNQIKYVSGLPANQRMFRLSGDLLPAYSHDNYIGFYFQPDVIAFLEHELSLIGSYARQYDVRLSFHPGQFCVLASDRGDVVDNSIVEFEYHCDIIRYLGYGRQFQDFKCNVHIGGKQGPSGIRKALKLLSPEARNCLTIENAEYSWGLEASLELVKDCALVLDVHHHWIATGEYIGVTDPRISQIKDSWRGVRPTMHLSVSREMVLPDHCVNTLPDVAQLKSQEYTSAKLRAHSDYYWNTAVNTWAATHSTWADIMCEAKQKNLASAEFAKYI